ncbi:hypothetical protein Q1695_001941 [Nippostrongylus brasiliensis]|nr:hypothetical protein Q1695_001941 [Nippostrongylus brasiliensis]
MRSARVARTMLPLLLILPAVSATFFGPQPCYSAAQSPCGGSYASYRPPSYGASYPQPPPLPPPVYQSPAQYPLPAPAPLVAPPPAPLVAPPPPPPSAPPPPPSPLPIASGEPINIPVAAPAQGGVYGPGPNPAGGIYAPAGSPQTGGIYGQAGPQQNAGPYGQAGPQQFGGAYPHGNVFTGGAVLGAIYPLAQQYQIAPPPVYVIPPPPVYQTPPPIVYVTPPPPKCWRDQDGFECCSKELQDFLKETLNAPQHKPKGCNLQKVANDLQTLAQNRFNFSFEAIVAQSEMANKSRFKADLMCKFRTKDGKIALIYATPDQYSLEPVNYHKLTDEEEAAKGWFGLQNEVTSNEDYGRLGIRNVTDFEMTNSVADGFGASGPSQGATDLQITGLSSGAPLRGSNIV